MPTPVRSLDHFVLATRDVQRAGRCFEYMGFHVTPTMRHLDIGTCNRVVQFGASYLELLGDLERAPQALRDVAMPRFACGEGLLGVSLTSADLPADRESMARAGLAPEAIISARRLVTMPDGRAEETDSRFCDVLYEARPFLSLFLSQHLRPETIWIDAYQQHANTARAVIRLTYVSDDPPADVSYFSAMIGAPPRRSGPHVVIYETSRGEVIELIAPERMAERYGELAPAVCESLRGYGIGLRFAVASMAACRQALQERTVMFVEHTDGITVPASEGVGVMVEFVQEQ